MRLTLHTDYALRILLQAAATPARRFSIVDVAQTHGISKNHAMKVVNNLARHGYLSTTRGRGGGLTLGRPPESIRLGDVVRLTEPDMQAADCAHCAFQVGCGLTPVLASAMAAFLDVLDQQTLADVLHQSQWPALNPLKAPLSAE